MSDYDCANRGHVWIEPDGSLFRRHNKRKAEDVAVTCKHCGATASLPAYSRHTAPITGTP